MFILGWLQSSCRLPISENELLSLVFSTETERAEIRSKTAASRLSDFKLATRDVLKRIGTARRRPASSCNAFAIATFSSLDGNYKIVAFETPFGGLRGNVGCSS